jgi:hypothetical protein
MALSGREGASMPATRVNGIELRGDGRRERRSIGH